MDKFLKGTAMAILFVGAFLIGFSLTSGSDDMTLLIIGAALLAVGVSLTPLVNKKNKENKEVDKEKSE